MLPNRQVFQLAAHSGVWDVAIMRPGILPCHNDFEYRTQ